MSILLRKKMSLANFCKLDLQKVARDIFISYNAPMRCEMNLYDPFNLLRTKKESIGKPPGTLSYSGNFGDVALQIDVITYNGSLHEFSTITEIEELLKCMQSMRSKEQVC